MNFGLTEEMLMLRSTVRDFTLEKIAPYADKWDEEHCFPGDNGRSNGERRDILKAGHPPFLIYDGSFSV